MNSTIFQTMAWFNEEYLAFPPYVAAFEEIESLLALFRSTGIAQNLFIAGESGSGKTTLCEAVTKKYPPISLHDRDVIPVLHVSVPSPATVTALAEAILTALGDPGPMIGTLVAKGDRIAKLTKGLKVELMLFDEAQVIQERGRRYTQYMAADWLKQRLDKLKIPTVFLGLPNFQMLLQSNTQLRRRFSRRRNLQLPSDSQSSIHAECLQMFVSLGVNLPLRLSASPYSWDELGSRIYFACDGRVGYIKKLLMHAIRLAMERSLNEIDPVVLEEVFEKELWWEGIGPLNPFNANFAFRRLDRGGEPFESTYAHPIRSTRAS
jgi:hypothetical protein